MLGQELVRVFGMDEQYEIIAWDRVEMDVTDFQALTAGIERLNPAIILNAVAYNAVDLCETSDEEFAKAKLLNTRVPEKLSQISQKIGSILVHYSTGYVFDGKSESGYDEKVPTEPLSHYGATKLGGKKKYSRVGRRPMLFGSRSFLGNQGVLQ